MRLRSLWSLPILCFVGLSAAGCLDTCEQLCAENARYIDGCLEHWEALWPDFGYDGVRDVNSEAGEAGATYAGGPAEEYDERCKARYEAAMFFSHPETARTIRLGCSADLQALAEAVGCDDYAPNDVSDGIDPTEGDNGVPPRP